MATAVLPTPVGPKTAMTCIGGPVWPARAVCGVSWPGHVRPHRHRPVDRARPARRGAGGGVVGGRGARRRGAAIWSSLFVSGAFLAAPEAALEAVHEVLAPEELIGCGAGGVIGHGREIETGLRGVRVGGEPGRRHGGGVPRRGRGARGGHRRADRDGGPRAAPAARSCSPTRCRSPPTPVLRFLSESTPMLPLLGGLASGRTVDDEPVLFIGDEVVNDGAVGVRLDGVEVLPMVSQGAAPIGPELTITAGEGHVIGELAGKPALEKLRETIEELPPEDLRLVQGGLLVGIVVDSNKPDYLQGDFLVRGLVGADPATGPGRDRRRRPSRPGRAAARARRRERGSRPARGVVDPHDRAGWAPAGGRAAVRVQRARAEHVRARGSRRRGGRRRAWRARRPPGSSPPARSARSAAATSCTASRPRWRCSHEARRGAGAVDGRDGWPRPSDRACAGASAGPR